MERHREADQDVLRIELKEYAAESSSRRVCWLDQRLQPDPPDLLALPREAACEPRLRS